MLKDSDLSEVERNLCAEAAAGRGVNLWEENGPSHGQDWPQHRVIRAQVLRRLLLSEQVPGGLTGVEVRGARITGSLALDGLKSLPPLKLCDCYIDQTISLVNAEAVSVILRGSYLRDGLSANQLRVVHDLDLSRGFFSLGPVQLMAASVGGMLDCNGGTFHNAGGTALAGDLLSVSGHAFLGHGFEAVGEVQLTGCRVGGQLNLTSGTFRNAIRADGLQVIGDMFCGSGFEADGEVRLLGGHIFGQLELTGGCFHMGVTADGLQVDQSVFCRGPFKADGEVRLLGARVGGQLELSGGKFHNRCATAINVERSQVGGNIVCGGGFEADGEVRLLKAHLGGRLEVKGGSFRNCGELFAVNAEGLVIDGEGIWEPEQVKGKVHLGFARAAVWSDGNTGRMAPTILRHFHYGALYPGVSAVSVQERLDWLRRDPIGYSPQPYSQLAAIYKAEGHDRYARSVFVSSQTDRRKGKGAANRLRQGWGWIMWATVGYGYRPWTALLWLAGATLVGSAWFKFAMPYMQLTTATNLGAPPRNAFLYTFDMLIPVLDLGYGKWVAHGTALKMTVALVVLGWVLVTAVVAAFAGVLRRGD